MPAPQFVAPPTGWLHVPMVAPDAIVQMPPQHSASCAHASPSCVQYDDGPQWPLALQSCEQHSVETPHVLPSVLHVVLSGVQVLFWHEPPQHSPSCVHAPLSDTHWVAAQTLPMQLPRQQSVFAEHDAPAIEHVAELAAHAPCGSQIVEQQSPPPVHAAPNTPHGLLASGPFPDLPPQASITIERQHAAARWREIMWT